MTSNYISVIKIKIIYGLWVLYKKLRKEWHSYVYFLLGVNMTVYKEAMVLGSKITCGYHMGNY